jgi:5-methylcytosine-specific restriction endonuclease McrA
MEKKCVMCGKLFVPNKFHPNQECCSYRCYQKKYKRELREKVINKLGGKCAICGYAGPALQIDHINNNGYEERKKFYNNPIWNYCGCGTYYYKLYKKILSNDIKDYQLLCANCNIEKEMKRRGLAK